MNKIAIKQLGQDLTKKRSFKANNVIIHKIENKMLKYKVKELARHRWNRTAGLTPL